MALLYQDIMNVPGLTGTSGQRQGQLYGNLGSPMGGYTGSFDQNMYLWNQIKEGNYGGTAPNSAGAPTGDLGIPTPNPVTPFESVMPYNTAFNRNLMTGMVEDFVAPEVGRQRAEASRGLESNLAGSGMWRTGLAGHKRQQLDDRFSRQQAEQTGQYLGQFDDWSTNWYNTQKKNYYENPAGYVRPELPTAESYLQNNPAAANAYQTQTNVPTTYKSPLSF